jgi:hypothetical protein
VEKKWRLGACKRRNFCLSLFFWQNVYADAVAVDERQRRGASGCVFALLLCVVVCVRVCKGDAGRGAERYSERERASGQVSAGRGEAGT